MSQTEKMSAADRFKAAVEGLDFGPVKPSIVIEHRETKERPLKVTLIRGAKGVYRWEITFYAPDTDTALEVIEQLDSELFQRFTEYYGEVESGHQRDTVRSDP